MPNNRLQKLTASLTDAANEIWDICEEIGELPVNGHTRMLREHATSLSYHVETAQRFLGKLEEDGAPREAD